MRHIVIDCCIFKPSFTDAGFYYADKPSKGDIFMSIQSQKKNMQAIYELVSKDLSYIYGDRESGPNGAKKQFHTKSKAFLRALGNDLGLKEFKVYNNYGGIAVSGEITLKGIWSDDSGIYVQLFQSVTNRQEFLYRSISKMSDNTGGRNQWLDCKLFLTGEYEELRDTLLSLRKSPGTDAAITTDAKTGTVNQRVA